MIYSVFSPAEGIYHYYETSEQKAVNADLPVPSLGSDAGKIGVPAMDAARALPRGAKLVGQGWSARGVISSGKSGVAGLAGFGEFDVSRGAMAGAIGAAVGFAMHAWLKTRPADAKNPGASLAASAAVGGVAAWYAWTRG